MPSSKPVVVFVRHGQSLGNLNGGCLAFDEINFLTPEGVNQAIAVKLPNIHFAKFYASMNRRSQQTLVMMLTRISQGVVAKDIKFIASLNEAVVSESGPDVTRRARAAVSEIRKALSSTGGNILVSSHNWIMANILDMVGFKLPAAAIDPAPGYAKHGSFYRPYIIKHCLPITVPSGRFS